MRMCHMSSFLGSNVLYYSWILLGYVLFYDVYDNMPSLFFCVLAILRSVNVAPYRSPSFISHRCAVLVASVLIHSAHLIENVT